MIRATRILTAAAVLALVAGCGTRAAEDGPATRLFLDVHELTPGGVTAAAVADAHAKDLAVEGKHGVAFEKYWVDEAAGRVYCLSHAPDAEAVVSTHREAHGLLPAAVFPVTEGEAARLRGEGHLFLDVHHLGAGNVTPEAVAEAHAKDLAVEGAHGVNFVQYWVDPSDGVVVCLSEAPDADAVIATHREAHGLLPDTVLEVTQGK